MASEPVDAQLDRPIVVIGSPRSGTTLLGNLLGAHPQLAHVEEPRLTWKYGNDDKSDMLRPADARPEVCQHIRQTFGRAVRNAGRQRLIEKTPSNSLRMGFVEQVLPGCLFVHTIRDGVESVLSIRRFWQEHARGVPKEKLLERIKEINFKRAPYYFKEFVRRAMPQPLAGLVGKPVWGPRIPGIDGLLAQLDLLEVCCLQWRMCVEQACDYGRQLPPERYMECRLEEMSPTLLETVLTFSQLETTPEVEAGYHKLFDQGLTTRRRTDADPQDLATIRRWIGPTMQWLGQDPP
ncbi:MAG: sulfotransferase [Bythopirellula sp.]|nr:sulfotransferase [Bythopirellula sp.]